MKIHHIIKILKNLRKSQKKYYNYQIQIMKLYLLTIKEIIYYNQLLDPINYIYKALYKKLIPMNLDLKANNNKDKKLSNFY